MKTTTVGTSGARRSAAPMWRRVFAALGAVVVMAASCSVGTDNDVVIGAVPSVAPTTDSSTAIPTAIPQPTAEPTVVAPPTVVATPAPAVVELRTFTSPEAGVSIDYPLSWVAETGVDFRLATTQGVLDDGIRVDEDALVRLFAENVSDLETGDPLAELEKAIEEFELGADQVVVTGPDPLQVDGLDGYVATVEATLDNGVSASAVVAGLTGPERYVLFVGTTTKAAQSELHPMFVTMVETIDLQQVALVTEAARLTLGESSTGTIGDADQVTLFEFMADAGDTLDVVVEPLDDGLDVVVDIVDSNERSIIGGELDDSFDTERIGAVLIQESGVYTVRVSGFADATGEFSVLVDRVASAGDQLVGFGDTTLIDVTADNDVPQATFVAQRGEWIDITVVPLDDLDVVVDVRDGAGISILPGGPLDRSFDAERIRVLEIQADGLYYVVVTGFQGESGTAEVVVELANNGSGTVLRGADSLTTADDVDDFPFNARVDDLVRLTVDPSPGHDVVLSVFDAATGSLLDDVDVSTGLEELSFEAQGAGDYYFRVSGFDGSVGDYDFMLLAPASTVIGLAPADMLVGRLGDAESLQYSFQPGTSGTVTISAAGIDGTEAVLSLFDIEQDQIIEAEDSDAGSQTLIYEVTADAVYLLDVTSRAGGGSFELDVTQTS